MGPTVRARPVRTQILQAQMLLLLSAICFGCSQPTVPGSNQGYYLSCGPLKNLVILDYGSDQAFVFNLLGRWIAAPMTREPDRFEFGSQTVYRKGWNYVSTVPGQEKDLSCELISRSDTIEIFQSQDSGA